MTEVYDGHFMYYCPPLDLETMTSEELEKAARWYMDAFLFELAEERRVSEGAERFLNRLNREEDLNGEDI